MAVLVEGISVVIKSSVIIERYPGGWESFRDDAPNDTLCADGELVRIGFMAPADAKAFVESLEKYGIVYLENATAQDMIVVDQQRGPAATCGLVECGCVNPDGDPNKRVTACRLVGSEVDQVMMPEGWEYENSLSSRFGFVSSGSKDERVVFLENRNRMDVYVDLNTGKEVYVGRTGKKGRRHR